MPASSPTMFRVNAKISPQQSSIVGYGSIPVPETTIPRSIAAFTSIDALRMPVVIKSCNFESRSSSDRGKRVRSRIATTISKSRALEYRVLIGKGVVKSLQYDRGPKAGPISHRTRRPVVVIEYCKSHPEYLQLRITKTTASIILYAQM